MWAVLLKPLAALLILGAICLPVRYLMRYFPEGKLKRLLLRRIS
jgi:hypothetical protein